MTKRHIAIAIVVTGLLATLCFVAVAFGLYATGIIKLDISGVSSDVKVESHNPAAVIPAESDSTDAEAIDTDGEINFTVSTQFCEGKEEVVIDLGLPSKWCDEEVYYITDAAYRSNHTRDAKFDVFRNEEDMVEWLLANNYNLGSVWTSTDPDVFKTTWTDWCANAAPWVIENGLPTFGCPGDYTYTVVAAWTVGGPYHPDMKEEFSSLKEAKQWLIDNGYGPGIGHGSLWAERNDE